MDDIDFTGEDSTCSNNFSREGRDLALSLEEAMDTDMDADDARMDDGDGCDLK